MIDSTNPRQLADNIRKLWDKLKSISGDLLPSRSTATTGQILKLTGENKTPSWADEYSYTPPAYSETEVNTGQKWNNKDVYIKVLKGIFPEISSTQNVTLTGFEVEDILNLNCSLKTTDRIYCNQFPVFYRSDNDSFVVSSVTTFFSECNYIVVIYYTKTDPAPETRDDDTPEAPEEVKETKTRKKTTK